MQILGLSILLKAISSLTLYSFTGLSPWLYEFNTTVTCYIHHYTLYQVHPYSMFPLFPENRKPTL